MSPQPEKRRDLDVEAGSHSQGEARSRSEAPTGHHPVEGVQRGHDPGPEKPAGELHIQEKSAGLIAGISASSTIQNLSGSVSSAFGAAKNRMSGSVSQQTFDEALKEHNGSVAANNEAKTPQ